MSYDLLRSEEQALKKARDTVFPFAVTGYLLNPIIVGMVAFGTIYHHVKADPVTNRFADGHTIRTSPIAGFILHDGFLVLNTRNSLYVCVMHEADEAVLINIIRSLPKSTYH